MKKIRWVFLLSLFISGTIFAQEEAVKDSTPFYMMSLEQLMNLNVTVASKIPMTNRESPGIISVINSEEIRKSGAQDLMQVLQSVPGFDFGVDVNGVIGLGVRGNWAHEGKVLLLIDGMEMNEDLYSSLQFGGHYPIDRIKKIEIIRGPGSSIYGDYAEYAVINIITKNDKDFNGFHTSISQSFLKSAMGFRNLNLAMGKSLGEAHINLSTSLSEGIRSDQKYTDYQGNSYDMTNQSRIRDSEYRLDFFWRGLTVNGRYNPHQIEQRDAYDEICKRSYNTRFDMGNLNIRYDFHSGPGFTMTPGIKMKFEKPWFYNKPVIEDNFEPYYTTANKNVYYFHAAYDPFNFVNLTAGVEYSHLIARQHLDSAYFSNGKPCFLLDDYATFFQSIIKLYDFNLIVGSRYQFSPYFGHSLAPRIALTRVWETFHLKAIYSRAFRNPSVENISISPGIKPERSNVTELEAGVKLTANSYLTANFFHIESHDQIVYSYSENLTDEYKNESEAGTCGFDLEYKWKPSFFYTSINYSFSAPSCLDSNCINLVPGMKNQPLAFARHMFNLNTEIPILKGIDFSPSLNYFSKRYSYAINDFDIVTITEYHPSVYLNVAVNSENLFVKGLNLQIACQNLLNERVVYIQPYIGNHEPLPGKGRELQLKISYSF